MSWITTMMASPERITVLLFILLGISECGLAQSPTTSTLPPPSPTFSTRGSIPSSTPRAPTPSIAPPQTNTPTPRPGPTPTLRLTSRLTLTPTPTPTHTPTPASTPTPTPTPTPTSSTLIMSATPEVTQPHSPTPVTSSTVNTTPTSPTPGPPTAAPAAGLSINYTALYIAAAVIGILVIIVIATTIVCIRSRRAMDKEDGKEIYRYENMGATIPGRDLFIAPQEQGQATAAMETPNKKVRSRGAVTSEQFSPDSSRPRVSDYENAAGGQQWRPGVESGNFTEENPAYTAYKTESQFDESSLTESQGRH